MKSLSGDHLGRSENRYKSIKDDKYYKVVLSQGQILEVPKAFRNLHFFHDRGRKSLVQADELTGLPVENSKLRKALARELTRCAKQNKNWTVMYVDLDQLKTANDKIDRRFGDVFILWGAAQITNAITEYSKNGAIDLEKKTILYRPKEAADELAIYFFDVTEDEMKAINEMQLRLVDRGSHPIIDVDKKKFRFSLSSGLVTSKDPVVNRMVERAKEQKDLKIYFELFNIVNDITGDISKAAKIIKDLKRLKPNSFRVNSINQFIELIKRDIGGSRVSEDLIEVILQLHTIVTMRELDHKHSLLLKKLNIKRSELMDISSIDELRELFYRIFKHIENKKIRRYMRKKRKSSTK
ncbi:diguanylate cyclase [Candidatus Roizmanbacteria bacterium]|nr:diguanylate cyclase [Candidatus Roizmanbacteria bacterium]